MKYTHNHFSFIVKQIPVRLFIAITIEVLFIVTHWNKIMKISKKLEDFKDAEKMLF